MASFSNNLGFYVWATSDEFSTAQLNDNFQLTDLYRGTFVCTSTTRPGASGGAGVGGIPGAWGAAQEGQKIVETDTGLTWQWNGSAFVRTNGTGSLGRVVTTTTLTTTDTWNPSVGGTYFTAISETVTVPNGARQLMVVAEIPEVTNASGLSYIVLTKTVGGSSAILNSYPVWTTQQTGSGNSTKAGTPGNFTTFDIPNAASATYSLCFAADPTAGGTAQLTAAANRPVSLTVIEL